MNKLFIKLSSSPLHPCVGCGREVNVKLPHYTGTAIVGFTYQTFEKVALVNVNPVEYGRSEKRIKYLQRKKGILCDVCASNYHTFRYVDSFGIERLEPMVKTDPLKVIGETTAQDSGIKRAKPQVLNTRITR